MLTILYFAWVRERIGVDREQIEVPADIITVAGLHAWLMKRSGTHAQALADRERLRVAVDQAFASWDATIAGAREVAFFPPVTGG